MTEDPINLIAIRRREVEQEIAVLSSRIDQLRQELPRLTVAEEVMGRLTGRAGEKAGAADESVAAAGSGGKPDGTPTITDMILRVVIEAFQGGLTAGLQPKEMTRRIRGKWWPDARGSQISSIAWRLEKRGLLVKDGPRYKLAPKHVETAVALTKESSAASWSSTRPVEAAPGGGT
jgi:hypothetical protein